VSQGSGSQYLYFGAFCNVCHIIAARLEKTILIYDLIEQAILHKLLIGTSNYYGSFYAGTYNYRNTSSSSSINLQSTEFNIYYISGCVRILEILKCH